MLCLTCFLFSQFERNTKKETLTNLRKHLKDPNLVTATRYYVCVPDQCAHTSHALGAISGLGLPLDQRIIEQISKLSKSGMLERCWILLDFAASNVLLLYNHYG